MRTLLLSDLHANLEALDAVLDAAGSWDRLLVLGDLVGYGPDPNLVVDRIRALGPQMVIRGNHDKVASGLESSQDFNETARRAAEWTQRTLSAANRTYLAELPEGPSVIEPQLLICHGTPFDEDAYIVEQLDALQVLQQFTHPVCFFGHTHVQIGYWRSEAEFDVLMPSESNGAVVLEPQAKHYLLNPGSVGQPRDGDPRAAYAVYDDRGSVFQFGRAAYAIDVVQEKIRSAGLPDSLARRLALGR